MDPLLRERIAKDLNSSDPRIREKAKSYLEKYGHLMSESSPQPDLPSQELLERIREDINGDDPVRSAKAMQYQDMMNKALGRSDWGRHGLRALKSGAKGIAGVLDIPAYPFRKAWEKISGDENWQTLAEMTDKGVDRYYNNYTAPTSKKEKIADSIVETVSTLPVIGPIGKGVTLLSKAGSLINKAGKGLQAMGKLSPQNIASAAGAGAAAQAVKNESPNSPWLAFGAGVLGGASASAGLHGLSKGAAKGLKVNKDAVQAYRDAGIPYGLIDASESRIAHMMKDSLSKKASSENILRKYREAQMKAVEKGLGDLGATAPIEGTGESLVVRGTSNYLKKQNEKNAKVWKDVNENIARVKDQSIPLHHIGEWLDGMATSKRDMILNEGTSTSKILKDLLKKDETRGKPIFATNKKEASFNKGKGIFDHPEREIIGIDPGVDYNYAHRNLQNMGLKIKTDQAQGNYIDGELKHLASLLRKDIDEAMIPRLKKVDSASPDQWLQARDEYAGFATHDRPHINKLLKNAHKDKHGSYSSRGMEPEIKKEVMGDVSTGSRGLVRALEGLSDIKDKKAVAQFVLKNLGKNGDDKFNPSVLQRRMSKLPASSKAILVNSLNTLEDKDAAKRFFATLKSIERSKMVNTAANHSGSAHHIGLNSDISDYIDSLKSAADSIASGKGISEKAVKTALSLLAGRQIAKGVTNQKIVDWGLKGGNQNSLTRNTLRGAASSALTGQKPIQNKRPSARKIIIHPDAVEVKELNHD